jgi:putative membrane protein
MERRLLKAIMTPAMIVSLLAGLWLMWDGRWWATGWFWAKSAGLVGLFAMHGMMARWVKDFAADRNVRTHKFYRVMNEIPTALMVAIVIFVIVKPF